MKKQLLFLLALTTGVFTQLFGYEFTIFGYAFDFYTGNPRYNQFIIFNINELGLTDSVYTDSSGFYEKTFEIPSENTDSTETYNLTIESDNLCNLLLNESTLNLQTFNGQVRVDLAICQDSLNCFSDFFYQVGDDNSVEFYDLSSGDVVSWLWDFGDGTTSTQQNPEHYYQNTNDYNVTLKITTQTNCTSTSSQTVHFENIYIITGKALAGSHPLKQGRIINYEYDSILETFNQVDNNMFSNKYGEFHTIGIGGAKHLLYIIPQFNAGNHYFPEYFPTYYGNTITWDSAVSGGAMGMDSILVELKSRDNIFYGHGSITGQLMLEGINTSSVQKMCVLLLNKNMEPLKYHLSDFDIQFELDEIPVGEYYLLIDIVGVKSTPTRINITEQQLHKKVSFNFDGEIIVNVPELESKKTKISPNPVVDYLNIQETFGITQCFITTLTGQVIMRHSLNTNKNSQQINVQQLQPGYYIIRLNNGNHKTTLPFIKQ